MLDPEAPSGSPRHGRQELVTSWLVGAFGIGGLTFLSGEVATPAWFAASLAAAIVRPDRLGFAAAWLGAFVGIAVAVPIRSSSSPTTAGDPFWIGIGIVVATIAATAVLALSFGAAAGLLRTAYPPSEGPTPAATAPGSALAPSHSWSE